MAESVTNGAAMSPAAIALNRFGLGARPDEPTPGDPKASLRAQFDRYEARPAPFASLRSAGEVAVDYAGQRQEVRATADEEAKKVARRELRMEMRGLYRAAVNARAETALTTPAPFVERLVHFWSNHFAVSADKLTVSPLAGAFEAEAIRPHVLGRFEDMLLAVERHPAMQLYLDQVRSVGPGSLFASRATTRNPNRRRGLNENLAREIMELHTTGARWGYFHPSEVSVEGTATGYCRDDKDDPNAQVQFCSTCGSTTHFVLTENATSKFGNSLMGVNMWLADLRDLAGIELRYPDGQAWSGEGDFAYVREAEILGQSATSE